MGERSYKLKTKYFRLGDIAIDSDAIKHSLWTLQRRIKIAAVRLTTVTIVTAANTNYNTFKLTDGTNIIASIANGPVAGGTTWAAGVAQAMTLVAAYQERAAAAVLKFEVTKTGNGLAMDGAALEIDYYDYDD